MGRLVTLRLDRVRIDGGTQPRVAIDEAAVAEYAEAADLPPVQVVYDGADYWLWDGFHRYHAAARAGRAEIAAEVTQGAREAAVWLATGANRTHGLRRTNADKRNAALMAIRARPDASDRAIAEHVGVSHTLVADVRRQVEELPPAAADGPARQVDELPPAAAGEPARRTGRDGKSYPAAPAREAAAPAETVAEGDAPDATADAEADPAGLPLPDGLRGAFAILPRFAELVRLVRQAQKLADELARLPGGELYRANLGHRGRDDEGRYYCEHLKNALAKVEHCRPFASGCPYCPGHERNCRGCQGRGWVNRACWESAPADYRDAVALARGPGRAEP